jgi:hypothetical protein
VNPRLNERSWQSDHSRNVQNSCDMRAPLDPSGVIPSILSFNQSEERTSIEQEARRNEKRNAFAAQSSFVVRRWEWGKTPTERRIPSNAT